MGFPRQRILFKIVDSKFFNLFRLDKKIKLFMIGNFQKLFGIRLGFSYKRGIYFKAFYKSSIKRNRCCGTTSFGAGKMHLDSISN